MIDYFRTVFRMSWALVKGLLITLRYMFKPAVTIHYPYEKKPMSPRFRGALAFHPEICISCDMCVRVCPSDCISLESKRNEKGKKDLLWYQIDFAKCNFCRLCEEICPTKIKSVHHTMDYELAFTSRKDFIIHWKGGNPADTVNKGRDAQAWAPFLSPAAESGIPPEEASTPAALAALPPAPPPAPPPGAAV